MESAELLNKRFDEHRRRQGLPCSRVVGAEGGTSDDVGGDTGDEHEGHPPTTAYVSEDKSRKGSVDAKILPLVTLINSTNDLFTTSTCSGRTILFTNESVEVGVPPTSSSQPVDPVVKKIRKKGCQWLFVSHDEVKVQDFLEAWNKACATVKDHDVIFKVEASILHVQCRQLSLAKKLIHTGTESGFRNSGMVIGKDNRITVAIRSALGFEIPLPTSKCLDNNSDSSQLVSEGIFVLFSI
ncbi:tRNA wybutosine-synthesizing protein 3 homolog isoform X2 [Folsomia candida]|uniref:tRNA wybutosine-synthesizing protein 3 homolog isoform X2 n=1 Tax=Folsomia candida TaxID=158441 RepID=UPI000B8F59C3|nr:tRNA wybutosine-synthesizing protein 3 homolog isoform X2 [Folsomia candida]